MAAGQVDARFGAVCRRSRRSRSHGPGGGHDTWLQLALFWAFCRIDYQLATPGVAALARREHIYLDQRFSDHAPLTIDYDFKL